MKLLAAVLLLILSAAPALAEAVVPEIPAWTVNRPKSSIQFKGFSNGKPYSLFFQSWSAEIAFDPDRPQLSSAIVTVDTRSASTGAATYKDYLVTPAWFDPQQVPYAQFHMTSFTKLRDNVYQGNGILHLYNEPKTVLMPFPGISIPFQVKFTERKKKPTQAEFTSNFAFAVPDFSPASSPAAALKRPAKKINFVMVLKAEKAAPKPAQSPKGK